MPPLSNIQHEEFAFGVAHHGVKRRAAIDAGYSVKCADVAAAKLMKRPEVKARIEELQDRKVSEIRARRPKIDREWAETEAMRNYEIATNDHSRFKWFEMLARMSGLLIDRSLNVNANLNSNTSALEAMPPDHMQALLQAVRSIRAITSGQAVEAAPPQIEGTVVDVDDAQDGNQ